MKNKNVLRQYIAMGRKKNEYKEFFTAWIKPHNSDEPYRKIENCHITCGNKEGCYGITVNGKTFDHIEIEQFNDSERNMAKGNKYNILFLKPENT